MPTRLYWNYMTPDYYNWASSWPVSNFNAYGGFCYYGQMLDTVKLGVVRATDTPFISQYEPPPYKVCIYRGISRPLLPQTIGGTVNIVFFAKQLSSTAACYTRVQIYVMDVTGSPYQPPALGPLLQNYDETPTGLNGTVWPTLSTGIQLKAPATLTPVIIPNDGRKYRMVVEVGYTTLRPTGTNVNGSSQAGSRSTSWEILPDLVAGTTNINQISYCDFSQDLLLGPAEYTVPNYDVDKATDVGAAPVSFQVTGAGGSTSEPQETDRWYKYTQGGDEVVSILSCGGGTPGSVYNQSYIYSQLQVGTGPPLQARASALGNNSQRPLVAAMQAGGGVYFRVYLGGGVVTTLSVTVGPKNAKAGDLMINVDDSAPNLYDPTIPGGNASVWYSPDGTLSQATANIGYSELGVSLADGSFGIATISSPPFELIVYDRAPSLALLHRVTVAVDWDNAPQSLGTDMRNFYVALSPGWTPPSTIVKYTKAGVQVASWTIQKALGDQIKNFGVSRDGTVAYIYNSDTQGIYRHDLIGDAEIQPELSPPTPTGSPVDVIVMSDNTIVTVYQYFTTTGTDQLFHFAPDGTILHTWTITDNPWRTDHIVHECDDSPDKIWIWFHGGGTGYKFKLFDFVHGVVLKEFTAPSFNSSSSGQYDASCNPVRFGAGSSCALFMMMIPAIDPGPPVLVTCPSGPFVIGEPYSFTLTATGGTPPYQFALGDGALPPGLTLDPATGVLSGIPTTVGSYCFTIIVTEAPPDAPRAVVGATLTSVSVVSAPTVVPVAVPVAVTLTTHGPAGSYGYNVIAFDLTTGAVVAVCDLPHVPTSILYRPATDDFLVTARGDSPADIIHRLSRSLTLLSSTPLTPAPAGSVWDPKTLRSDFHGGLYLAWAGSEAAFGDQILRQLDPVTYAVLHEWRTFVVPIDGRTLLGGDFSLDGQRFLFSMGGGPDLNQNRIYALNLASGLAPVFLTYGSWSGGSNPTGDTFHDYFLRPRPDGSYAALTMHVSGTSGIDANKLLLLAADGTVLAAYPTIPSTSSFRVSTSGLALSPDGQTAWFTTTSGVIGRMNLATGAWVQLVASDFGTLSDLVVVT